MDALVCTYTLLSQKDRLCNQRSLHEWVPLGAAFSPDKPLNGNPLLYLAIQPVGVSVFPQDGDDQRDNCSPADLFPALLHGLCT